MLVIAGLGPYGTEAASEFAGSPQYLAQLAKVLPRGWENMNFELVIKTAVMGDTPGPPELVYTYIW